MAKVVGIKFKNTAKVYYFAPSEDYYEVGSGVIVETAKGQEYATVSFGVKEVDDSECVLPLKPIVRKANRKDAENIKKGEELVPETIKTTEEKINKLKLPMKVVSCEYSFDLKKVVITFSAENRVDFRELVKELAPILKARIELRQIGIRDEVKILGGIAPCGRECCCGSCLPDFRKVSIKMAKTQGLSLNPTKISGLCGRLMCCLDYENEYYSGVYKKMPKLSSVVTTPEGEGTVVSNNMLTMITKVKITKPDGSEVYKDFPVAELKFKGGNVEAESEKELLEEKELDKMLD